MRLSSFVLMFSIVSCSEIYDSVASISAEQQELQSKAFGIKFVNELLDFDKHGKAGVMSRPWSEQYAMRVRSDPSFFTRHGCNSFVEYDEKKFQFIILHYTASPDRCGVAKTFQESGTSAHFLVENNGDVISYVDPYKRIAYHAGTSYYANYEGINFWSIGIEHSGWGYTKELNVNPYSNQQFDVPVPCKQFKGDSNYWYEFSEEQFTQSCKFIKLLQDEFKIPGWNVVTHADIAYSRKSDIGPMWDYERAYKDYGVGFFPDKTYMNSAISIYDENRLADSDYLNLIHCFGYKEAKTGTEKTQLIRAYRMHYSHRNNDITSVLADDVKLDIINHAIALGNAKPQYGKRPDYFLNSVADNERLASIFRDHIPALPGIGC